MVLNPSYTLESTEEIVKFFPCVTLWELGLRNQHKCWYYVYCYAMSNNYPLSLSQESCVFCQLSWNWRLNCELKSRIKSQTLHSFFFFFLLICNPRSNHEFIGNIRGREQAKQHWGCNQPNSECRNSTGKIIQFHGQINSMVGKSRNVIY